MKRTVLLIAYHYDVLSKTGKTGEGDGRSSMVLEYSNTEEYSAQYHFKMEELRQSVLSCINGNRDFRFTYISCLHSHTETLT